MGKRGPKPHKIRDARELLDELPLPPERRTTPGRRADSAPLVTDYTSLPAEWFSPYMRRSIPMPRGRGYRQLVCCPGCDRWVLRLYLPPLGTWGNDQSWRCRHCLGLHYESEYAGRRPEAAHERLQLLIEGIRKARSEETRTRRTKHFLDVLHTLGERELKWLQRFLSKPWEP